MNVKIICLALAILVYSLPSLAAEPLSCEGEYKIPRSVEKHLIKQFGRVIEIRVQDQLGYITELFYNHMFLKGWFFQSGNDIVVCAIDYALELDTEGRILFIYDASEREM